MGQFDEIREILKNLTISQAETNKKFQELAVSQAKTEAQIVKTEAQIVKTEAQIARTEAQMAKTDAKLKKIGVLTGNISNSQGEVAEEFFYNCMKKRLKLNKIQYDFIYKNVTKSQKDIEDEYDILMVNGQDVAIIEVKYKAHQSDLERFIHKKYENFKKLYPEYSQYKHHLALASFKIHDEVKGEALKSGVIILQRKGKVVETTLPG